MLSDIFAIAAITTILTLLLAWAAIFVGQHLKHRLGNGSLSRKLRHRGTLAGLVARREHDERN